MDDLSSEPSYEPSRQAPAAKLLHKHPGPTQSVGSPSRSGAATQESLAGPLKPKPSKSNS